MKAVIVTVDYEKCFDRVEFNSIKGVFKYFGFGENFIKMLSLLFANLELCTFSNEYTSKFLNKNLGTNQRDPASPLIFNFCGEILAHLIHQNKNIRGIEFGELQQILSQFADDTAAFLICEPLTISNFTKVLTHTEEQMGLKVSYDKTTVCRVGSLRDSEYKLITQKNLKWSNEAIELLGVNMNCDGSPNERNFDEIIVMVKKVFSNWSNRKSILYGLFVHKITTMLYLGEKQITLVEQLIREFIWNNKKPKISLGTLTKRKYQGDLGLIDLKVKQNTLMVPWIFKLLQGCNEFLKTQMYNKKPRGFMQSCFAFFVYFKCCSDFLLYFYKCSTSMAFT